MRKMGKWKYFELENKKSIEVGYQNARNCSYIYREALHRNQVVHRKVGII